MFSQSVNRVIPTSLCKLKSVCHKQIYPLKDVKDFLTFPIREKKKKTCARVVWYGGKKTDFGDRQKWF